MPLRRSLLFFFFDYFLFVLLLTEISGIFQERGMYEGKKQSN